MLAFDLETTGLCPFTDKITCAALCDLETGRERVFIFAVGDSPDEFLACLDSAPRLCAFNGVGFDLPFIRHQFGVEAQRVRAWQLKLFDVYEACRLALKLTFPLSELLRENDLSGKTGNGADAVSLAHEGRWSELGEYCLNDARQTLCVSTLARIRLPKTHGGITLDSQGCFRLDAFAKLAAPPNI